MSSRFLKDPDAVLDYKFDWTSWLTGGETITSHQVIPDTGITVASHTTDGTSVTIWLTGGTAPTDYNVVCRVTTSAGRTDDRTMTLTVQDR